MEINPIPRRITDRSEAARQPQDCEATLAGSFDNALFGMCVIGLDGRFLHVDRALSIMLGHTPEALLGTCWTNVIHSDDVEVALQTLESLTHHPVESKKIETRLVHHSGAVLWARISILLAGDKDKRPLNFVVHVEDISDRKRANESRCASEERFRIIADSCPSMMWATDPEGNIQFVNRACRTFTGMNREELYGGKWQLPLHPTDAPGYLSSFDRAIREHIPFSAEARVRRADGEWRLLGARAEPSLSSSGEYLGHIGLTADITERILAEQTRQFELSLIRSIHEGSLDGILVVNGDGIVVSHNAKFLDVWGLSSLDASGEPLEMATGVPDSSILARKAERVEDPEAFVRRVRELYDSPQATDHCEVKLRDGRTLERDSASLRNEKGEYLGRVWFFRDVTTRKREEIGLQDAKASADEANRRLLAERSILESERKMLRALIDNIPDFMYVKDTQARFVVANSHLAHVVGMETPEQLLGKTDFDFFPLDMARAFYEDDRSVIHLGQHLHNREERGVGRTGNETRILTTKVPLRDINGVVVGLAGVGRDITVRKKMEDALREAERKYRGIFDEAIVGIFQSTPEGRFLSVNPSMASTYGYGSPEEMIESVPNMAGEFYVDPKRRDEFLSTLDKVGGVQSFEFEAFRRDGSKIWVSMNVRAIHQNGEVVRFEGMCEDITERNLMRVQLVQVQKLESVGQLAAGIAHEINTPTQYIGDNVRFLKGAFNDLKNLLGSYQRLLLAAQQRAISDAAIQEVVDAAEYADAGYLLEEIPKAIEQTLDGVTRVSTLVRAMKEFSHPGTKEKVLLDINHAIDSTITVARNEWKYVANMETDLDLSLPLVPCQPGEFNQVILNLIVNAAHAIADVTRDSDLDKGSINIRTRNFLEWVEIRVQDSGSGIPEGVRTRVFDPFFTTKEIGKGTGQGLAIARSVVVDKHGGTIHFETETGIGTTFVIRLPHEAKAPAPKAIAA